MRLPALFALAALVGLSACDSAKVSELTGAKPAPTQIAAACPPAAAPACPPAQPVMAPEAAKPAPVAAPAPRRIQSHAKAHAWAQRHHVRQVKAPPKHHHAAQPRVRHFAYAGGYAGEASAPPPRGEVYVERHYVHPPVYARPNEADGRQVYRYERREDGYAQDSYRYERRAPYVDERRDDGREAYRYEHREGSVESSASSSSYERRESGSSSSVSGGGYGDDCNCRPQAAGRDRQGFLTWPGKR